MLYFTLEQNKNMGIIFGDYTKDITEKFSISNPGARFARFKNKYIPSRIYAITKNGRFNIGLFPELLKYANTLTQNIQVDPEILKCFEGFKNVPIIERLGNYQIRDYQKESVRAALRSGRGVISVGTAGGKTLTMAYLLASIFLTKKIKAVIIVPNRSLVTQTYNDFIEYNVPFSISKWTGDDALNTNTDIIITNIGILQSKNTNLSFLKNIDVLLYDECLRQNTVITTNKGNIQIQNIKTGDLVKSFNIKTKQIEYMPVLNTWQNLYKSNNCNYFLSLELEDGKTLQITPNHKIYTQRGYIRADELTDQDEVMSIKTVYIMNLWYKYLYFKANICTYMSNLWTKYKISFKTY